MSKFKIALGIVMFSLFASTAVADVRFLSVNVEYKSSNRYSAKLVLLDENGELYNRDGVYLKFYKYHQSSGYDEGLEVISNREYTSAGTRRIKDDPHNGFIETLGIYIHKFSHGVTNVGEDNHKEVEDYIYKVTRTGNKYIINIDFFEEIYDFRKGRRIKSVTMTASQKYRRVGRVLDEDFNEPSQAINIYFNI